MGRKVSYRPTDIINFHPMGELYEETEGAMTQLSDDQVIALSRIIRDPKMYIETTLHIQDKRGDLVDFILNKPQLRLYAEYKRQMDAGQPIRIIILKARQMGFSTLISALFYHAAATTSNTNATIVAHKADVSTSIFNKQKLYYDTAPTYMQPMRKASNAKELIFENPTSNGTEKRMNPGLRSRIEIETAVSKEVARGKTIQFMHLSELSSWPYAEETMTACLQAVPSQPGTAIIIESTANGVGGAFYDEWMRAESGLSPFVPIFFPWFEMDEYRMLVPPDFVLTEEEKELKEQFNLDDEQLVWRRWCISANCRGDINVFHQEYPSTPHEAFLASGRPVFDVVKLEEAMREASPPKCVGRTIKTKGVIRFQTGYGGYLKIWEPPEAKVEYIIGADVASGESNGDYSCAVVMRSDTRKQVAEWHGHLPPDLFGEELDNLGRYYNMALIVPEANNHGVSTIDSLRRLKYPFIFRRRPTPDNKKVQPQERYGWWTSEQSKKVLINNFAKFVRERVDGLASKDLMRECITYVYDDKDRSNAQQGCYDDRVIAAALACYGLHLKRKPSKELSNVDIVSLYNITSPTGY